MSFSKSTSKVRGAGSDDCAAEVEDCGTAEEAMIANQQKQIEALTAGLQKVSAQLEASKPAPQVVNNP